MSAKAKTPEAIDVGAVATEPGSSLRTRAKDPASVIPKGNEPTDRGPVGSDAPAKVNPDAPAVPLTVRSAAIAGEEKASLEAKPDDQPVASQAVLSTETVLAGNDSSPQAKSADQEPVGLETSPPTVAVRADHGPSLTAKADEQDAASLPASHVPDESDHAPDRIGLHTTTVGELVSLGQDNFAALLKAGQIWTTGLQELATQVATSAQASLNETLAVFTALSSAKSPQHALDLQTKLVRSALERTLAESSRIADASVKLFEQTLAPLTARAPLTVETFSKRVA
jgi:phasin family protein